MRASRLRVTAIIGSLIVVATLTQAQRAAVMLVWLPRADSLPSTSFTLVVREQGSHRAVAHPLVCVLNDTTWMVGMADGRLRFGGHDLPARVRLRVLGPQHMPAEVTLEWEQAQGRAAVLELAPRANGPVDPGCDEE